MVNYGAVPFNKRKISFIELTKHEMSVYKSTNTLANEIMNEHDWSGNVLTEEDGVEVMGTKVFFYSKSIYSCK